MPHAQNPGSTYRTSDLYYAAYLKVAGIPFKDAVKEEGRVFFLFEDEEDSPAMRSLRTEYFNGKAKVPALDFAQTIKTMKSLTHM